MKIQIIVIFMRTLSNSVYNPRQTYPQTFLLISLYLLLDEYDLKRIRWIFSISILSIALTFNCSSIMVKFEDLVLRKGKLQ